MPKWLTDFLETKPGKIAGIAFAVIAVCGTLYLSYNVLFGPDATERLTSGRVFIDSTTGKPFNYTVKLGDKFPIEAPSGSKTGYPTEACYWTADGKIKQTPTFVLTNEAQGKPGPSYCPDCGRLVVPQNPTPLTGDKPPPTKAEKAARPARSQ